MTAVTTPGSRKLTGCCGSTSARRGPINGNPLDPLDPLDPFDPFDVGPGAASFGRWLSFSHGHSSVGWIPTTVIRALILSGTARGGRLLFVYADPQLPKLNR